MEVIILLELVWRGQETSELAYQNLYLDPLLERETRKVDYLTFALITMALRTQAVQRDWMFLEPATLALE